MNRYNSNIFKIPDKQSREMQEVQVYLRIHIEINA